MAVRSLPLAGGWADLLREGIVGEGARNQMARVFVIVSLVPLAFNDLPSILPVGELSRDGFIYMVPFLTLYLMWSKDRIIIPTPLVYFVAAFSVIVLLGVAVNYNEIIDTHFKGRSGFSRVVTQGMSFAFGVLIAFVFYNLTLRGFVGSIVLGARAAILVMAAFGIIEVASWYSIPGLTQLHDLVSIVVHSGTPHYPQRLRSTAFEVSWTGVMLTFFFPFATINDGCRKKVILFYIAIVAFLVILSQSRTAMLVFGFQILLISWFYFRHRVDVLVHIVAGSSIAALLLVSNVKVYTLVTETAFNVVEYGRFSRSETAEENVSNITRSASISAGISMLLERPILGVGFAQFGFHYPRHLDADDFRSYEVRAAVKDNDQWPPSYSLHARMLAETGIVGYLAWLGFIVVYLIRSLHRTFRVQDSSTSVHLGIAMTLSGWLLLGFSIDSFRFFGGWIAVGVALALQTAGSFSYRRWSAG
ncbi:O-antigen ligase family protein [Microvirga aerilata]|uniref:O-antigen ligase family protein n=1 Tax=Microvirga aerilata TaxID=670292 RepID=A0A936ZML0_9HYPH|nr:O-antigen ligase family protein [Microvirga aerilata]MBL0407454.1 O-antigen ligase family protein [Microvirga aerilata]